MERNRSQKNLELLFLKTGTYVGKITSDPKNNLCLSTSRIIVEKNGSIVAEEIIDTMYIDSITSLLESKGYTVEHSIADYRFRMFIEDVSSEYEKKSYEPKLYQVITNIKSFNDELNKFISSFSDNERMKLLNHSIPSKCIIIKVDKSSDDNSISFELSDKMNNGFALKGFNYEKRKVVALNRLKKYL